MPAAAPRQTKTFAAMRPIFDAQAYAWRGDMFTPPREPSSLNFQHAEARNVNGHFVTRGEDSNARSGGTSDARAHFLCPTGRSPLALCARFARRPHARARPARGS